MQLVTAVVEPDQLGPLGEALQAFGFHGFTVVEASGFGRQAGAAEVYRGAVYVSGFRAHVKVEIVAPDDEVRDLIDLICGVVGTSSHSDGKIWVLPVSELVRIRTKQTGVDAL